MALPLAAITKQFNSIRILHDVTRAGQYIPGTLNSTQQ